MFSAPQSTNTYLEQDPVLPHQSYCLFSFLPRKEDLTKKFNKCRYEKIQDVLDLNADKLLKAIEDKPAMITAHILTTINDVLRDSEVEEDMEKHKVNGAVKFRGSFQSLDDAKKYSTHLSDLDNRFDIYLGQTGFWYPFDPPSESVKNQEFRDEKLNGLMQGYLENKTKSDIYFKQRMREMMEKKIEDSVATEQSRIGDSVPDEDIVKAVA
mgnify:CR=1 FL=1